MTADPRPFGEPRRKPTRAERKRRAQRSRLENARAEDLARQQREQYHAQQPGTGAQGTLPPLLTPATPTPPWSVAPATTSQHEDTSEARRERAPRVPRWWWLLLPLLIVLVAGLLWTTQASPALTGTWNLWWFAGTALAALAGIALALRWYVDIERRLPARIIISIMILGLVSAVWGSTTTVVIGGKPYTQWSTEAQIDKMSRELYADMLKIAYADELLAHDAVTARVRFTEYAPAQDEMLAISAKWDERLTAGLPTEQLAGIVDNTRAAAYWAADGLQAKEEWVVTSDAQVAARVTERREQVASLILAAGAALNELTALYGINLDLGAGREVVE